MTSVPARTRHRVITPLLCTVTTLLGADVTAVVHPSTHITGVPGAGRSLLPIVTSARAAGATASTISVQTATTSPLIRLTLTQPGGTG